MYRAVKPNEFKQISETSTFKNLYGIERKYFSTSLKGAQQFARMVEKAFGDEPYEIVKTSIPKPDFESLPSDLKETVDRGVNAVLIPTESLSSLSQPEVIGLEITEDLLTRSALNVNP